jgi:hypothetical protein
MPSGVFKITDIPEAKVPTVVADYELDGPEKIEKIKQANGLWTVKATFPGEGESQKVFGAPGGQGVPGGVVGGAAPALSQAPARGALEFAGAALPLTDQDIEEAARRLGCDVAAVRAVAQVESSGGGFLPDGRPKILFESHKFSGLTGGRYDTAHPDISTPTWVRNYLGGAAEYDRLAKAIALDREAALKSASWGLFQILGSNHSAVGYDDVEAYVAAQSKSEGEHLRCFVNFVVHEGLADHLKKHEWEEFARHYNGPGYKENKYDTKIAQAYQDHAVA